MDVATGRQTTITHGEAHSPAWSPDGRRIAFAGPCCEDSNGAIYVVDADGSNLHRLTSGFDAAPAWSPDGTSLVFSRQADIYPDVWIVRSDGTAPHLLVKHAVADW
jgi:TolB protein